MLKTKGLINTRKRQRLHIKPCSLQAVNNYQTAFESRVKKKMYDLQATVAHSEISRKKSKGTKVNERESKDNACATFDGQSIFRNGPSSASATSRRMRAESRL